MGFLGKEKTSKDYLKDIAKSQKAQEKAAKQQASAITSDARTRRLETVSNMIAQHREISLREADATLIAYEECKQELQNFYASFDFDINDINDIEQKAIAMISWLDTVDRTFKDKKSSFRLKLEDNMAVHTVDNDNKSKEKTILKKLAFATERLGILGMQGSRLEYIANKLKFYNDRTLSEAKASKSKVRKVLITLICVFIVPPILIIVGIAIDEAVMDMTIAREREKDEQLISKAISLINQDNLEAAYSLMFEYNGYDDKNYNAARDLLCGKLLAKNELEKAKSIERFEQDRYGSNSDELIGEYLINQNKYDEAKEYFNTEDYTKAVIKHMCKKGRYNEARKFVKRQSANCDAGYRKEFHSKMNAIINSYL